MASDYQNYDKPYRRGLVLGLSLAEVFLILLFLLLVTALNIVAGAKQEISKNEEAAATLAEIEKGLQEEGIELDAPDFASTLSYMLTEASKNKSIADRLRPISDVLEEKPLDSETKDSIVNDIAELVKTSDVTDLSVEFKSSKKELALQNEGLIERLERLGAEKGEMPPCWFVVVNRELDPEKEIKSYDIRIMDNEIDVFVRSQIDSIREKDSSANFGRMSGIPTIDPKMLNTAISYQNFVSTFMPIYEAGEQRKVQDYRCRFFVALWDETSNKEIYKTRKLQVESMFYTYEHKSSWPHDYTTQTIVEDPIIPTATKSEAERREDKKCGFLGLFCKEG